MSLFVEYKTLANVCLFCSLVTGNMIEINFKKVAATEGKITKTVMDTSTFDCALRYILVAFIPYHILTVNLSRKL